MKKFMFFVSLVFFICLAISLALDLFINKFILKRFVKNKIALLLLNIAIILITLVSGLLFALHQFLFAQY